MESLADLPITGVCIVSDPAKCPPNYTLLDKTYDRSDDADLWKDGLFGRRVMRYLCVWRCIPDQSQDVLVDVALINERESVPPGFTVVEHTHDSREKAMKKRCLCVRWMVPSMTSDAITELILLTRNTRRAPVGYTLVGEINNLSLCYKMGKISKPQTSPSEPPAQTVQTYGPPTFNGPSNTYSMSPLGSSLPYASHPPGRGSGDTQRPGPPERTASTVNPLSGVEWKMNPKYNALLQLQNVTIPEIWSKTMGDIEREYQYDFVVENSVTRSQASMSL